MSDEVHDYDFFNARSSIMLEVMAHLWEGDGYQELNLYSVWRNYYDAAMNLIPDIKIIKGFLQEILRMVLKNLSHMRHSEISAESFTLNIQLYLFQIRVGKQIYFLG